MYGKEGEVGREGARLRRNRKKIGVRSKTEFERLFFQLPFQDFFFAPFRSSPSSPPPLSPSSSASRGNGRFLGRRSKRRNCLRVQSSKKASSIWRDRVRRARRPLPGPPACAAAAAPASCRWVPEPGPGASRRARTRTLSHTDTLTLTPSAAGRTRPHAPSLPGPHLLGPGLLCCAGCGRLPVCVPLGVTVRVVCRCGVVPWGSLRAHHAGPRAPALPSQEPAAPEVSHFAEVVFFS